MNLTALFEKDAAIKDAAIVNHQWMQDGIIHPGEPQLDLSHVKKPNNIKPELEIQWGGGGSEIDLDQPAGVVTRTIPEESQGDVDGVILFARDLMNRGLSSQKVISALKKRYGSVPKKAEKGLIDLFKMDGILGRFAVDARGYDSCKDALKAASQSPYKRFIHHVVGCECGDPHLVASSPSGGFLTAESKSTGNPMDDFLASEKDSGSKMVAHCHSTMLPIMAVGDLDQSELDDTLVEMMNVTGLPGGVKDEIMAKKCSNTAKLRAAFRWLDKKACGDELSQYDEPMSQPDLSLVPAMTDIDLSGVAVPDIEINPPDQFDAEVEPEFEFEPMVTTNLDGMEMGEVPSDVAVEVPEAQTQDVEMGQFMEPEFEGTDEVELNEPVSLIDEVIVDMLPEPDDDMEFLSMDKKAMEFDTKEEMEKYKQEHDVRPGTEMKVVENKKAPAKKEEPAKKSKPLSRDEEDQISNALRDHLSGTERVTTKENMQSLFRSPKGKKLTDEQFSKVWDSMVEDGYLIKTGDGYRWNNEGKFDKAD